MGCALPSVKPDLLLAMMKEDWKSFLVKTVETGIAETIRKHERTGKP